jgi:tRNA(Ile)-lysidine synthase
MARRSTSAADLAVSAAALTDDEFAGALDRIGGFETQPLIAVAVSGGPDSMALAMLADRWARLRGGEARAVTVDHGLRPESADEALTVAGWLAARGVPHEILTWTGAKPKTGVQEAAREARYRLLAGWCRAHGCLHLLTGHHREDQAETYLIRRRAGSGVDGLAGMPLMRELDSCRLLRPLLAVPRSRLAALLAAERQPFLRDPSNENPAFERARLRLGPDRPGAESVDTAIAESRSCGRLRLERERQLDRELAWHAILHPAGFGILDAAALGALEPEMAERALACIAATVGGARYPARRERVARLLAGLTVAPERARTLGGCRFVPWRGRLLVLRELARAEPPVRLEPGECRSWDRRFCASVSAAADGKFTLGYLGQLGDGGPDRGDPPEAGDVPRLVYPALPAFWDQEGLAAVPTLAYRRAPEMVFPELSFRPANPLTTAGFTVV